MRQKHDIVCFLFGKRFIHGTVHLTRIAFFGDLWKTHVNFTSWTWSSAVTFQHNVNKAQETSLYAFLFPLLTPGIKGLQGARILTTCHVLSLPMRSDDCEGSFGSVNFQVEENIQGWEKSVKENPGQIKRKLVWTIFSEIAIYHLISNWRDSSAFS